jgi:hypothetical protein
MVIDPRAGDANPKVSDETAPPPHPIKLSPQRSIIGRIAFSFRLIARE